MSESRTIDLTQEEVAEVVYHLARRKALLLGITDRDRHREDPDVTCRRLDRVIRWECLLEVLRDAKGLTITARGDDTS